MKNFQQTPKQMHKQRRAKLEKNKAALRASRNMIFQPREAWENKATVGGVPLGILDQKQFNAPGRMVQSYDYRWLL